MNYILSRYNTFMTRALRIQFDGAWYHIMNRGAERKPIFNKDHHKCLFLYLLAEIVEAYKIEIQPIV